MRLVHYGDERGGGTLVISAPEAHVARFKKFLVEDLGLGFRRFPKHADRKRGFRLDTKKAVWIFPPARGTSKLLIPAPGSYPCDICEFAQYNHLCQHQKTCAVFIYWTMGIADKMHTSDDASDLPTAFMARFGPRDKK